MAVEPNFESQMAALVANRLGGDIARLSRLTGGASQELWSFDVVANGAARGFVLRRAPAIEIAESLATIGLEKEAAVIGAVGRQGVPVPTVVHILQSEDGLGRGFVASRMPGEALGRRIVSTPELEGARQTLAAEIGTILARIHATPIDQLPPLTSYSPAGAIDMLERQLRASDEPRPVFEVAIRWLRTNCPPPTPDALVHADFRTGNYLLEPGGVSAVLDWEGAHLGDPMEDLGWFCLPTWRFGRNDRPAGGIGSRADLYAAYETASGRQVDRARVRFWEIRGLLRWGMTCLFMAESFLRGDGHLEWAAVGRRASEAELELLHALSSEDKDA